jgi:thiamine phosphate synthase YjbQ (UPF0047 family)
MSSSMQAKRPNIDSDHYLVKMVIRQKVPIAYRRKKLSMKKWNKIISHDLQKQRQFRTVLHKELSEGNEFPNINEE